MVDISKVIDLALDYNPGLAIRDLSTIHMWCNEGCDVDKDILPTMKDVIERRAKTNRQDKIGSFSYFNNMIRAARDKRLTTSKVEQATREKTPEEKAASRARTIAFYRKIGRYIPTYDEAFLAQYEQQHGEIKL